METNSLQEVKASIISRRRIPPACEKMAGLSLATRSVVHRIL
jgi:hypothetical protein